jgi:hypothetical protein
MLLLPPRPASVFEPLLQGHPSLEAAAAEATAS